MKDKDLLFGFLVILLASSVSIVLSFVILNYAHKYFDNKEPPKAKIIIDTVCGTYYATDKVDESESKFRFVENGYNVVVQRKDVIAIRKLIEE